MIRVMLLMVLSSSVFMGSPSLYAQNAEVRKKSKPTREEAATRAELLHETIHATIHLIHHEYYKEDQALAIPAAAIDDVFSHLEQEYQVKFRWLVVEGQAMNTDHIAADEFEKNAVLKLKDGKKSVEEVASGIYRRAGPITLTNVCLKCHIPDRTSTDSKTAGLIISIPVQTATAGK